MNKVTHIKTTLPCPFVYSKFEEFLRVPLDKRKKQKMM